MRSFIKLLPMFSPIIFLLTACGSMEFSVQSHLTSSPPISTSNQELEGQTEIHPDQAPILATPVSQEPAAGICGAFEGELVIITINSDIPDPRCVIISPVQMLKIVNRRHETLQVSLVNLETTIESGGEHTFQMPFGQYLAPGVHYIEVLPCCGAALWLQKES